MLPLRIKVFALSLHEQRQSKTIITESKRLILNFQFLIFNLLRAASTLTLNLVEDDVKRATAREEAEAAAAAAAEAQEDEDDDE